MCVVCVFVHTPHPVDMEGKVDKNSNLEATLNQPTGAACNMLTCVLR